MDPSPNQGQKANLESLSKDEIINKYKGLLAIAKKAKQAKDEMSEENCKLKLKIKKYETQKDADKKALITMKEMLEAYTENKLQLTTLLSDLQKQHKLDLEKCEKLSIENESYRRQLTRLSDDNDSLLANIEKTENELKERKPTKLQDDQKKMQLKDVVADNERLRQENEVMSQTLNELKEKYSFLKEVSNEQRKKFNLLKERFIEVHKNLKKLKECKRILLETQHEYADSVSQWQMEIIRASKMLCKELNDLKAENICLLEKLKRTPDCHKEYICKEKLAQLLKMCEKAVLEYSSLKQENIELKKVQSLPTKPILLDSTVSISSKKLEELLRLSKAALQDQHKLRGKCNQLSNESSVLQNRQITNENSYNIITKVGGLKDIADKAYNEYKEQANELALLRLYCEKHKKESENQKSVEKQIELDAQKSAQEYQKLYKAKEKEHHELLDEMRELNEALKVRGDCISRLQEELKNQVDKMHQLQRQINEKDDELKMKNSQLDSASKTIEQINKKVSAMQNENLLKVENIRELNIELEALKCAQTVSADTDNQSEVLSTSTISRADEMQRNKDIEESFEDKYNKLRGLAARLKKKLQEEISQKQELEKELSFVKTREVEVKSHLTEAQLQCSEMDSLKTQVAEKQKQIENLKSENQKLRSSRKQANVLNLEIEAAEKSLTDVTNKLALRTSELDTAQEYLKAKESTIKQLRKEIELLESSKFAESKHSQDLRNQIDHLQNTLKDAVHSKQQAFDKTKILEQDVENLKSDLEAVKLEMSTATNTLEMSLRLISSEKVQLAELLSTTQATLEECEHKTKQAERATEDIKLEYLDYKIKAQSVLRKNRCQDSSKERELEEELLSAKNTEIQLKATIETLTSKLEQLEKTSEIVSADNASLQLRSKELMQLIEDMRLQNDALQQEIQTHIQQQHELLKQHRQHIDSLDNCHKEQLQSINSLHQRQIEQLKKEIAVHVQPIRTTQAKSVAHTTEHEQSKFDFLLMEREDAEGSEEAADTTLATLAASRKISNASSSSNVKRSQHDFMPLDELLNTPINAISSETLITSHMLQPSDNNKNNIDLLQMELNSTKDHLHKQETRVRHLTTLLAENEQDLAKLTQMNDMLKEELRKQERSVEREQHMHNSEYIKNVIMKFITLNNVDERTRLVPVLNTVLKLSRSEAEILNCVAKGIKVSDPLQQRGSGWGNFLPWVGSGGNNNSNK